jgi:hypothetical protein
MSALAERLERQAERLPPRERERLAQRLSGVGVKSSNINSGLCTLLPLPLQVVAQGSVPPRIAWPVTGAMAAACWTSR